MAKTPIIIGIDPGYDRLGWAVGGQEAGSWNILAHGCIQTDKKNSLERRYQHILTELKAVVKKYQPDEAAIETLFWSRNKSTAMAVSESRGLILAVFIQAGLKIAQYTPLQIKQAVTGYGRADKKAVEKMVRLELGISQSEAKKIIDDTFDALALIVCHHSARKLNNL